MGTTAIVFALIGIFLLMIIVLTFIHELGHFGVAKIRKVRVAEFSIGFGPAIKSWKLGETKYSLRWIPLGGYVSVLSNEVIEQIEEIRTSNPTPAEIKKIEKKMYGLTIYEDYSHQSVLDDQGYFSKMSFILGGIFMNFMIGWIAIFTIYMVTGKQNETDIPMITAVNPENNINYGFVMDEITYMNEEKTELVTGSGMATFYDVIKNDGNEHSAVTITFTIKNESIVAPTIYMQETDTWITIIDMPEETDPSQPIWTDRISIVFDENDLIEILEFESMTFWEALWESFADAWYLIGMAFVLFFHILTLGFLIESDPWSQSYLGEESFNINFYQYGMLFANLSFILFSFNLIPLPPLDGYKAYEFTYEKVTGKKTKPKTQSILTKVGYIFIALIFIMSFFTGWW